LPSQGYFNIFNAQKTIAVILASYERPTKFSLFSP